MVQKTNRKRFKKIESKTVDNMKKDSNLRLKHAAKVNHSRYRPGVAQISGNLRLPYYMTTAQDDGKVVSLTHRPHLPSGNTTGTHFS